MYRGLALTAVMLAGLPIAPAVASRQVSDFHVRDTQRRTLAPRTTCNVAIVNVWVYKDGKRLGGMRFNENVGECSARLHGYGVAVTASVRHHRFVVKIANANHGRRLVRFVWMP